MFVCFCSKTNSFRRSKINKIYLFDFLKGVFVKQKQLLRINSEKVSTNKRSHKKGSFGIYFRGTCLNDKFKFALIIIYTFRRNKSNIQKPKCAAFKDKVWRKFVKLRV